MNGKQGKGATASKPRGRDGNQNKGRNGRPRRGRSIERPTPVAYAQSLGPQPRQTLGYRQGWMPVRQPENILQVVASTTETKFITIPIISGMLFDGAANPGYGGRARYLAGIGQLHAVHRWRSISFEWLPSCTTQVPGNVVLRFYPNYKDPTPAQMIDLMDVESLTISPYLPGMYRPRGTLGSTKLNIGATAFLALDDQDKFDYSIGRLVVAVDKQATELSVGFLRIHPHVEFQGPVTPAS